MDQRETYLKYKAEYQTYKAEVGAYVAVVEVPHLVETILGCKVTIKGQSLEEVDPVVYKRRSYPFCLDTDFLNEIDGKYKNPCMPSGDNLNINYRAKNPTFHYDLYFSRVNNGVMIVRSRLPEGIIWEGEDPMEFFIQTDMTIADLYVYYREMGITIFLYDGDNDKTCNLVKRIIGKIHPYIQILDENKDIPEDTLLNSIFRLEESR